MGVGVDFMIANDETSGVVRRVVSVRQAELSGAWLFANVITRDK